MRPHEAQKLLKRDVAVLLVVQAHHDGASLLSTEVKAEELERKLQLRCAQTTRAVLNLAKRIQGL